MGLQVKGVGVIAVVCKNCGFIAYWYAIGDHSNKAKFNGPPTPAKAKSGHDGETCPCCGRRFSDRPEGVYFMTYKKFTKLYYVKDGVMLAVREQTLRKLSVSELAADFREDLVSVRSLASSRQLAEVTA
ncbi:MAG: hypothetical protein QXS85_00415 [Acidilobaceae archaeon]